MVHPIAALQACYIPIPMPMSLACVRAREKLIGLVQELRGSSTPGARFTPFSAPVCKPLPEPARLPSVCATNL